MYFKTEIKLNPVDSALMNWLANFLFFSWNLIETKHCSQVTSKDIIPKYELYTISWKSNYPIFIYESWFNRFTKIEYYNIN
jgi:hypothetical protein